MTVDDQRNLSAQGFQDREVAKSTRDQQAVAPLAAGAGLPNISALPLREVRRLAELTLNQGDGEWLPYEETWYEIATGLTRAVDALQRIEVKASVNVAGSAFDEIAAIAREALNG